MGRAERLHLRFGAGMSDVIFEAFPELKGTGFKETSKPDPMYNCIAWAAGESDRWWEPSQPVDLGYYWPEGVPQSMHIKALIAAYAAVGFASCSDGALEPGFVKVALFAKAGETWTHAARQLPSGKWTSKLGSADDIQHDMPVHLRGEVYGVVHSYMKRPIT